MKKILRHGRNSKPSSGGGGGADITGIYLGCAYSVQELTPVVNGVIDGDLTATDWVSGDAFALTICDPALVDLEGCYLNIYSNEKNWFIGTQWMGESFHAIPFVTNVYHPDGADEGIITLELGSLNSPITDIGYSEFEICGADNNILLAGKFYIECPSTTVGLEQLYVEDTPKISAWSSGTITFNAGNEGFIDGDAVYVYLEGYEQISGSLPTIIIDSSTVPEVIEETLDLSYRDTSGGYNRFYFEIPYHERNDTVVFHVEGETATFTINLV